MSRVYLYALVSEPLQPFRVGGRSVRSLEIDGIHAVVDRNIPDEGPSEAALRRQHLIVEAIAARAAAVLPARFGSLVDVAEVRDLVRVRRSAFEAALELVRDREQMTLRFPKVSQPTGIRRPSTGTAYLRARRTAGLPDAARLQRVREALASLVRAERIQPGRGSFPAALFHLIDRGTAAAYRERVTALPPADSMQPQITGPWPAFAFAPELFG